MALVTGHHLAKSFGPEDIFDGIDVSIPHGARIALVGPNGSGKTTLLRLLAKQDTPTEGRVSHARNLRIGFLPQEARLTLEGKQTLWDEMVTAFAGLLAQEARLNEIADSLARQPNNENLLAAYGEAQSRFETAGGYEYSTRIQQVLSGLGFDKPDFSRPLSQLSGGQKTRALLARLLLEDPDLLILDEPTNHLDIQAIEWLEHWLKGFSGALLIVSHDRYFMDKIVDHIWELVFGHLEVYRGNYSHYAQQREERHTYLLSEYKRQQEFIAKEEDYIRRNIAGQNTRQAQGRRKRLERFLRDEAIRKPHQQRQIRVALQARRRSGDKVIETKDLVIGYHDNKVPLFKAPDITLYRRECAALIGPNGAGKSTFIKTVLGQLVPLEGQVRIGASVEIGYFAQAHEELNLENNVFDEILSVKDLPISEIRDYLAKFLFTGDDIYKPVSILSGGERGRVALAKLALSGANLLLLDEPTNHLDIPSQEILETVLEGFEGTILLVSHDRYLIRSLATQVWNLYVQPKSAGGQTEMTVYEGPYDEYLAWREGRPTAPKPDPQSQPAEKNQDHSRGLPKTKEPRLSPYERKRRLERVEDAIHRLEIDLVNLSGALEVASAAGQVEEVASLGQQYAETEAKLAALMDEWEMLIASSIQESP